MTGTDPDPVSADIDLRATIRVAATRLDPHVVAPFYDAGMAWTELQPDGSLLAVAPETCARGHLLRPPNVLIGSNVTHIWWECGICGSVTRRSNDAEWVTQGHASGAANLPPVDNV